jgi:L-erythro-3,5-diaminohexanoate dehydrogenase
MALEAVPDPQDETGDEQSLTLPGSEQLSFSIGGKKPTSSKLTLTGGQIEVEGQAILFASGLYARLPGDIPEPVALAILDVAGAPAQTARLVRPGDTVLVVGGGGKSGTLCVYEARKRAGPAGRVIGLSPFAKDCERMRKLGWVDHAVQVDATDAVAMMEAIARVTAGQMADVTINCVNIQNTEMGSILSTRERGKIYFFSMATSFTAAALGAEGVGKDVEMIVGNGYAKDHAVYALALLALVIFAAASTVWAASRGTAVAFTLRLLWWIAVACSSG